MNIPAGPQDSAGEFENAGPDGTFSISDRTAFGGGATIQLPTQQLRLLPFAVGNPIATARGGSVTFNPTANGGLGAYVYTPPTNFYSQNATDVDTFVYRVRDNGYSFSFLAGTTASLNPPTVPADTTSQELEATGTITLIVNPSNDRPEVNPGTFEALEDVDRVLTNVLAFSNARPGPASGTAEIDGLNLTVNATTLRGGTASLSAKKVNGDYDLTYRNNANLFGQDVITFTLTDVPPPNGGAPQTITYSITVTVRPVNDNPLAADDRIYILEDSNALIVAGDVTRNDDVDAFGNTPVPGANPNLAAFSEDSNLANNPLQRAQDLRVTTVRLSPNNTVTGASVNMTADGRIRVVPPANYYSIVNGNQVGAPILIEYTLQDTGSSFFQADPSPVYAVQSDPKQSVGTITVDIYQVNDAPIGTTHNINDVQEDTPRVIQPGELLLVASDVPNSGDIPPTSKDSAGPLENVGPDNRFNVAPFNEIGLTQNLRIVGLGTSTANPQTTITTLRNGTVTFVNGVLTYTPPLNFSTAQTGLTDTFTYIIRDDGTSASLPVNVTTSLNPLAENSDEKLSVGTVTLSVNAVNDPPEFFIGADLVLQEDETLPSKGYNAGTQEIVIPDFAVGIRGGPSGARDEENQTVSFQLSVVDGDAGIFAIDSQSGQPTISLGSNGTLRLKQRPNASGFAVIRVIATDNLGATKSVESTTNLPITFTVTVAAVNDAPEFQVLPAVSNSGNRILVNSRDPQEDEGALTVPVLVPGSLLPAPVSALPPNLSEALGGGEVTQKVSLFVELVTPGQSVLFTELPRINDNGELIFTTAPNAFTNTNPVLIRVYAIDNGLPQSPNVNRSLPSPAVGGEVTLTLSITPVNDPPLAVNDPTTPNGYTTNERTALTISAPGILENDRDPETTSLAVATILGNSNLTGVSTLGATITGFASGQVTYDPRNVNAFRALAAGAQAIDTFTYTATDGALTSNTGTVTVVVTGVNDAPVAVADAFRVGRNRQSSMTLTTNDTDIDSRIDPASVIVSQAQHGVLTVLSDGTVVYTPTTDYVGIDQFTYTVDDIDGSRSQPVVVTLTVDPVPTTTEDFVSLVQNRSIVIKPLDNDQSGLNPASLQILGNPANGTIQVNPTTGEITYTPAPNFVGSDFIVYSVKQSGQSPLESDATRITIGVTGSAGQSAFDIIDVNNSGQVSALDALLIINHLNGGVNTDVNALEQAGYFDPINGPFVDVNGSGAVQPLDALLVINYLNQQAIGRSEVTLPAPSSSQGSVSLGSAKVYPAVPMTPRSGSASSNIMVSAPAGEPDDIDALLALIAQDRDDQDEEATEEDAVDAFWDIVGGM